MPPELPPGPPYDPRDDAGAPPPPALRLVPAPPSPALAPAQEAPPTASELRLLHRAGAVPAEELEGLLHELARAEGVLELAIGEAWAAVRERFERRGSSGDAYAWQRLGYREHVLGGLCRLAEMLAERPLLREALRTGAVRKRHALAVLALAKGPDEARWVEAARTLGHRALEQAVRRERGACDGGEDCWHRPDRCCARLDERAVRRALRLLERIPWHPPAAAPEEHAAQGRRGASLSCVPDEDRAARGRERLEAETRRWARLASSAVSPGGMVAGTSFQELDARLRELTALRGRHGGLLQVCAAAVLDHGAWRALGFRSFDRYCEERLGLSAAAVRRIAALEPREAPAAPAVAPGGEAPALRSVPPPPPIVSAPPALLARSEALARAVRLLEAMFPTRGRPPLEPPPPPRAG